jgi:ComF family protein
MTIGEMTRDVTQRSDVAAGNDAAPVPRARRLATMSKVWGAALDVLLPPLCLSCQSRLLEHDALCAECWRRVDFIRPPLCDRLGLPMPYDTGGTMISAAAAADPPPYDRARAVARYDGVMRDLIHDFKFRDTHDARRLFGRWLVQAAPDLIRAADCIVPVPLAWFRLLTRRFNQAQLLAAEVSNVSGKPIDMRALVRQRATAHQIGLTRSQRQRNVAGAFSVRPGAEAAISGKSILLIDDVITTGATVGAAARVLKKAGAARVDVLALALVTDPS